MPEQTQYILMKTDSAGPDVAAVAAAVQAAAEMSLLHQSKSALLVSGAPHAVQALADGLVGWHSELNGIARAR